MRRALTELQAITSTVSNASRRTAAMFWNWSALAVAGRGDSVTQLGLAKNNATLRSTHNCDNNKTEGMARRVLAHAATSFAAVAAALVLVTGMVTQYQAQLAARDGVMAPVEMLTEMLHDPACAADGHCRSACRMVCDEIHAGQGARQHAATLISFGCCLSSPIITKQQGVPAQLLQGAPSSPLQLLANGQPAHEDMLFQVNSKGHVRFDRPADTRRNSIAVHILRDRHSLAANLKELEHEQAALAKRVSKLKLKHVLPFRVAKGQSLIIAKSQGRGSGHPGKLFPEGPGTADPYYEQEDKLPDNYEEPDCDLPYALRGKVNCSTPGSTRVMSDTDPFGVERQAEMARHRQANWSGSECSGPGCPEQDSSWQEYESDRAALQSADQYGMPGTFLAVNDSAPSSASPFTERRSTDVEPFGTAWKEEEDTLGAWCGDWPDGSYQLNAYECFKHCVREAKKQGSNDTACVKDLKFNHLQHEWIHKPGCVPNVTIDGAGSLSPQKHEELTAADAQTNAAASCMELIPMRTMNDYGYKVASGNYSMQDMEAAMEDDTPTPDAIKAYLGDDLYNEYAAEEDAHVPYGNAHMRLQVGQQRIRKLASFKKAYGGKTEYEWCLEQHRGDRDFPKACTGDGKHFVERPWGQRHKPRTAPEEAMEGIAWAVRSLIGDDHDEKVVEQTGPEAIGQTHTNKFENGAVVVQPGHVSAEPAPWMRNRGVRYTPQSHEGRAAFAREQAKLPGVVIDDWSGATPMTHHSLRNPIAYSPNSCCAHFVDYSEFA